MIRADLRHDGDRCPCGRLLAEAEVRRVIHGDEVDVLALCRHCGTPTIISWVREVAR